MFQEEIDPFEEEFGYPKTLVTKLTLEEIQIALSFLKRRFPRFSIQKIVSTLDHYNYQKTQGRLPRNHNLESNHLENTRVTDERRGLEPSNKQHDLEPGNKHSESKEDRKAREGENLRLVARLFCEGGDDYKLAKRYMPQLSVTGYRNMLLSIANNALKQLLVFLRKQCSINAKDLSQAQKVTIKTAIISAHEWMGTKSLQALQTLFKFISNKFSSSHKPISKQEAIELYSVIAKRVNHSHLDLTGLQPEPAFGHQLESLVSPPPKKAVFHDEEQIDRVIAESFLQECTEDNMSNHLTRKYGILKAWENDEIHQSLRRIVATALDRLITTQGRKVSLRKGRVVDRLLQKIMSVKHLNIKYALVQFYLNKLESREIIASLAKQINSFIDQASKDSSNSISPGHKLQTKTIESDGSSQVLERTRKASRFSGNVRYRGRIVDEFQGVEVGFEQRNKKIPGGQYKMEDPNTWEYQQSKDQIVYFEE